MKATFSTIALALMLPLAACGQSGQTDSHAGPAGQHAHRRRASASEKT